MYRKFVNLNKIIGKVEFETKEAPFNHIVYVMMIATTLLCDLWLFDSYWRPSLIVGVSAVTVHTENHPNMRFSAVNNKTHIIQLAIYADSYSFVAADTNACSGARFVLRIRKQDEF